MNKFEVSVTLGIVVGWIQLMCGFTNHAFYSLGLMIMIALMAILGYLRIIYLERK